MKTRKGFTLIELLIVITIIGILAVALLPRVLGAPQRARDASRKAALQQIATVLESYMSDNGVYPAFTSGGCINDITGLGSYFDGGAAPKDPISANGIYNSSAPGTLITGTLGCYYYQSLTRAGVVDTAYIIVANTEKDCTVATDANCVNTTNLKAIGADSVEEYQTGGSSDLFTAAATGNLNAYALMR